MELSRIKTIKIRGLFNCRKNIDVRECERDLGVLVLSDGTCHEQVNSTAAKADRVLKLIDLNELKLMKR